MRRRLMGILALTLLCSVSATTVLAAKTRLKVWGIYNPKDVGFDKAIAEYEGNHPGVKVDYNQINFGTDKFLTACAGGASPDIIIAADEWIRLYIDNGLLSRAPRDIEDSLKREFFTGVAQMASRGGKTYGLPVEFQFYALVYNTALFQESGLPPQAPTTWEETSLAGRKLARWDGNKIARTGFCAWANGGSGELSFTLLSLWQSNGAENLPDDMKALNLVTRQRKEGLEFLVDQVKNGADGVNPKLNPWTDFPSGKLAMWIEGLWVASQKQVKNATVWKAIDIAPIPKGRGESRTAAWSWLACVPQGSKHKADAWAFVKTLTNAENGRAFADAWNTAIPRIGVASQRKDHLISKIPAIAATISTRAIYNKAWPQISDLMGVNAFNAIVGKVSVDDALAKMEAQMKALQKR